MNINHYTLFAGPSGAGKHMTELISRGFPVQMSMQVTGEILSQGPQDAPSSAEDESRS